MTVGLLVLLGAIALMTAAAVGVFDGPYYATKRWRARRARRPHD